MRRVRDMAERRFIVSETPLADLMRVQRTRIKDERGFLSRLHMVDLTADDIPVAGFRRTHAFVEEDFAGAQNHQAYAEAWEIDAGLAHEAIRPWRCQRSA